MAINTAAERAAGLSHGMPWRLPPQPDGSVDRIDRASVEAVYFSADLAPAVPAAFWSGPYGYRVRRPAALLMRGGS